MRTYSGPNAEVVSATTAVPIASSASRKRQALALFILTLQNTALVLVTKFSYRQAATPYVVSTVIASSELVKLVLSYILLVASSGQSAARDALREVPSNASCLAVPSLLYVIQNNLLFEGVRLLSPTAFMVCSQEQNSHERILQRLASGNTNHA